MATSTTIPSSIIQPLKVDMNVSIINYLLNCPEILSGKLFFNFADQKDDYKQIVPFANDETLAKPYIDGSVERRHTTLVIVYKSISHNAIVKVKKQSTDENGNTITYEDENVTDFAEVNSVMEWIEEQNEKRNFPFFGTDKQVEKIYTLTNIPQVLGVNSDLEPPLAQYQIGIAVEYLDTSKMIWK